MRVMCVAPNFQNYGDLLSQLRGVAERYCISVNNVPIVTYEQFVTESKNANLEDVRAVFLVFDNEFLKEYDGILRRVEALTKDDVLVLGFVLGMIDQKLERRLKRRGITKFIGHLGHAKKREKANEFLNAHLPNVFRQERPIRKTPAIHLPKQEVAVA